MISMGILGKQLIRVTTQFALAIVCLPHIAAADILVVAGLEDAANWMPCKIYRLDSNKHSLTLRTTITADHWFKTIMVDPSEHFAVLWAYDLGSRNELNRPLTFEERAAMRESPDCRHVILVSLTDASVYRLVKLEHSAIFGGTLAYDSNGRLCAMSPGYEEGLATFVDMETEHTSVLNLDEAPWGRLALRGPLYPTDDPRRINPSAIYRFIIDGNSGKLCHYMGSLDKEHKRFAASERLPEEILERYSASQCIRGWLECGNASVGLYRFFPEGSDGVLSEECDWLIHDRSRDGWSWKSDYDFIGYALLFDERIVFYEGQWEGAKEHFSGYFVRTGRHRCTDLALNTLFEFELPTDAMVLNIVDDGIIYRTGTTLWALPIIDNRGVGESKELCTDSRLEYANWVAPAPSAHQE